MQPILLLTKQDTWSQQAGEYATHLFSDTLIWEKGALGDGLPHSFDLPQYAAVISFLSPWIIPESVLNNATLAINFHPGSCDYPGTGCYNFALYEEAKTFGPVCHHMLAKVDTGEVIAEQLFAVTGQDSVETLKLKTMQVMLVMFKEMLDRLKAGKKLPVANRKWMRRAFTRKQLNALCEITEDMDEAEEKRRVRATIYPGYPGAYKMVAGNKQFYPVPDRKPLA